MKAIVFEKSLIDDTLGQKTKPGKHQLDPFTTAAHVAGTNITILEITADESRAEVHLAHIDFFYCLEGEVEFVTGGTMRQPFLRKNEDGTVNNKEVRAAEIEGGVVHCLKAGDIIWIPNGLPHSSRTSTHARLLVLKILSEKIYPLEEVSGWDAQLHA